MNKEEILKRSQTENMLGDERDQQIRIGSDSFSLIFTRAVTLLLVADNSITAKSITASLLWLPPYFVSQTSLSI